MFFRKKKRLKELESDLTELMQDPCTFEKIFDNVIDDDEGEFDKEGFYSEGKLNAEAAAKIAMSDVNREYYERWKQFGFIYRDGIPEEEKRRIIFSHPSYMILKPLDFVGRELSGSMLVYRKDLKKDVELLAGHFGLSELQTLLFAIIFKKSLVYCSRDFKSIAEYLGFPSAAALIPFENDLKEIEKKGLIRFEEKSVFSGDITVTEAGFRRACHFMDRDGGFSPEKFIEECDDGYDSDHVLKKDSKKALGTVIRAEGIRSVSLFFDSDTEREAAALKAALSEESFADAERLLTARRLSPCVSALLYGPPGTGKTELARQAARESGRDIFLVNLPDLEGEYWATEWHNMRRIFRQYSLLSEYYKKAKKPVPVLLMNECDSLMMERYGAGSFSQEKSTSVNILLNEMEKMSGILIATSNCRDSIDEAFDRRFLYKIEIARPSKAVMAKMLREKLSGVSRHPDRLADLIASRYDLSGAEIDNVIRKCVFAAAAQKRALDESLVSEVCEREGQRKSIGFEARNGR